MGNFCVKQRRELKVIRYINLHPDLIPYVDARKMIYINRDTTCQNTTLMANPYQVFIFDSEIANVCCETIRNLHHKQRVMIECTQGFVYAIHDLDKGISHRATHFLQEKLKK